jgi:hypothetical protein
MPISAKNKSPRGESGLDETSLEELTQTSSSESTQEPLDKSTPGPVDSSPAAAVVADASGEPTTHRYSATDAKLASRMSRNIAQHLGLSGKSRSVRI